MNTSMKTNGPQTTPKYAVIFTATVIRYDEEYHKMADQINSELKSIDGFISINSVCSEDKLEIAVSYWKDLASIKQWGKNKVHRLAMKNYKKWYSSFNIEVSEIISAR